MRNLGLIVAFWLATILPTSSLALGLGEIEVNSFLNQPLNAEIEVISARPGEIDDLLVSLASSEAFTRAGLSRPRHLSNLRFSVNKNEEGDEAVIIVSTKSAVKEPFLNFLIEADWSKGRVLREFTVLLDPPFYANQPAPAETIAEPVEQPPSEATIAEEASVSEIVEQSGVTTSVDTSEPTESSESITEPIALSEDTSSPAVPEPEPLSSEEYASDETRSVAQGDVSVVKGDTLWSIASRYKDDDHSMSQVMLAFQRANPDAFNDGNINNMKVGAVLRVPGADELNAIGKQESYAEVLVQNGLWDEYVARVTGVSPAVASDDGGSEAVAQDGDAEAASGELSLLLPAEGETESTGTGDTGDVDTLRTKLALAEEELEASRIENQELESRISELQARLSKLEELQKMVEIEDDSLAELQADQAEQSEQIEDAVEPLEDQAATETVTEAIEADEEALLEELLAEEAEAQAQEQTVIEEAVTEQAATDDTMTDDAMTDDAMSDDTVTAQAETDGMAAEDAETDDVAPPPAPVIVTEPVTRKPSIFDGLLPPEVIDMIPSMDSIIGDPIILAAVGGVILLLLILVFLKRRKGSSDEESSIIAGGEEDLFAGDDEDELTPIHLANGAEAEATDIHAPSAEDMVEEQAVEESAAETVADVAGEPQQEIDATAVIEAVEVPEAEAEAEAPAASTGEQDDVLNEVDVYLAYGLYDNAEELLSSSISEHPERADYRSKLLDTYFATKNSESFIKEAENLKSMGDSAAGYWDRVQIMGYELAPDNALFSDAKDSGLSAADLEISKPQEADFDLGASDDDTTNFSTTDFNLGEDDTGGDFSDTESMGEAGQIASTQVIPKLDELPDLDDEDDTNLPAEPAAEADLELPDDVGEELEFSMDEAAADVGGQDSAESAVAEDVDLDDMDMEFDIDKDEAATDDISEIDFGTEFEEAIEESDEMDLDESASAEVEVDEDAVELDASSLDEEGYTETAVITSNYEDTEVVPDLKSSADDEDDEAIDLGMDDTGMIDLDETSFETAELNLETAELNLDTGELDLPDEAEGDDDEDISIIDFGGEDFVEPTDIVESVDADDSDLAGADIEGDAEQTGTFAPGDFEEPTAAVDSLDDIDDLMLPDDVDEVSTKLDLARAFIDMGDNEGARGSLEEVIAEGNDDQKAEAKSLLDQI